MQKLTETDVKRQIKDCLKSIGARVVSFPGSGFGENGVADQLVCLKGEFIAIEVKRPGWKPPGRNTKAYKHYWDQKMFLESIVAAGGIGFFATSLEEVVERLDLQVELYPLFYSEENHGKL